MIIKDNINNICLRSCPQGGVELPRRGDDSDFSHQRAYIISTWLLAHDYRFLTYDLL